MANFGSVTNLKNDSIDEKVTTNGNGENTGVRVNSTLQDIVDTLTGSPVVSTGVPDPLSVFASAQQGLLADSAIQPTDLAAVAFISSGSYNDLVVKATVDGVSITGDGTPGSPFSATFGLGFQGAYDPTITGDYPLPADTIGAVPITAGMYWVISQAGTMGTLPISVNPGDGIFALVNNAGATVDADWEDFPALYGGLPVVSVTGLDTDNTNPQNPIVQIAVDGTTITGLGTSVSPLQVGVAPVLTGNVLYVDDVNGNDGTAVSGDLNRAYLTLLAAQTAAVAGDTIVVYPGSYTSNPLGKRGVNWYFMPEAVVSFTTTGWTVSLDVIPQSFSVYGQGEFNATANAFSFSFLGEYSIACKSMTGASSFCSSSVVVNVSCDTMSFSSGMAFNGGTSTISCPSITPGTTTGISVGNAELTINGNVIGAATASTLIQTSSSGSRLRMNGKVTATSGGLPVIGIAGGSNIITGDVLNSGTGIGVSHVSGNVTILNSQITTSGAGVPIYKFVSGGVIRLRDVYLFSVTAANTITGPVGTNVIALGCYSNNPLGANVTVIGDMKIGDTVAATANQVPVSLANGAWNWGSLPSSATLAGNLVIVDIVNGNDSTGAVGDLTKPYLTLLAAQAAASTGQTIVVYPGTYSSVALGKNGVNWYFMPGATVNFSAIGWQHPGPSGGTYAVTGHGVFSCSSYLVDVGAANTNIDILCKSATCLGFYFGSSPSNTNVIIEKTLTLTGNSTCLVGVSSVTAGKMVHIGSATTVFFVSGSAQITISGNIGSALANQLFDHNNGTLVIKNSELSTLAVGSFAIRKNSGGGVISLESVSMAAAGPCISTTATVQVQCANSRATTAPSAGVTIAGDLQFDYATPATAGQIATANADGTWEWTASTGGAALAGNVVIVDAINGDDATGAVGDLTKPYLTLVAAQTAASAGQTIVVYPGAYTSVSLGKDGVDWYFMSNALVTFSTGFGFNASTTGVSFSVRGFGQFSCPDRFLSMSDPSGITGSVIDIECDSIQCQRMVLTVGSARIKSRTTQLATAILVGGLMDAVFEGDVQSGTSFFMFGMSSGGRLRIKDSVISNGAPLGSCLRLAIHSVGDIVLDNVTLISLGPSILDQTPPSPQPVTAIASVASQSVSALVEINGNLQIGYLTPATVGQVPTANADGTWTWA